MSNTDARSTDQQMEAFEAARWRIATILALGTLVVFVSFLLMVGFARPLLGTLIVPGLTLGILLGIVLLYGAWGVTGIYVYWANRHSPEVVQEVAGR